MTDHELLLLKQVSGNATVERIDAELNRRIQFAKNAAKGQREVSAVRGTADLLQPVRRGAVIFDRLPPSHNGIWLPVVRDGGKPALILTDAAREWRRWASREAQIQWAGKPFFGDPVDITVLCVVKVGDRRDTPNLEKLLWDTLEGICYENDGLIRDRTWLTRFDRTREGLLVEIADHRSIAAGAETDANGLAAG